LKDNEVIEELLLHSPEGFGPIIFGQIDRLLQPHSLRVSDIDLFAAGGGAGFVHGGSRWAYGR